MVGPARKRQAVLLVQDELEVSEHRTRVAIRQPRATQRYRSRRRGAEAALAPERRRLSAAHPQAGYRVATALLRRVWIEIYAKRVQRLWRQEGLKVPQRQRERERLGSIEGGTQWLRPSGSSKCGAKTISLIRRRTGGGFNSSNPRRKTSAATWTRRCSRACACRGISAATAGLSPWLAVQDWIAQRGFKTLYIKPGSQWQNAYRESFNSRSPGRDP